FIALIINYKNLIAIGRIKKIGIYTIISIKTIIIITIPVYIYFIRGNTTGNHNIRFHITFATLSRFKLGLHNHLRSYPESKLVINCLISIKVHFFKKTISIVIHIIRLIILNILTLKI